MEKMKMMQDKFLMLASKLNVTPDIIEKINESFMKMNEEKMEDKMEDKMEGKSVDITKQPKTPMPSEEDIDKMEKEELVVFAKGIIKNPEKEDQGRANGQEHSPYMIMMKNQGY